MTLEVRPGSASGADSPSKDQIKTENAGASGQASTFRGAPGADSQSSGPTMCRGESRPVGSMTPAPGVLHPAEPPQAPVPPHSAEPRRAPTPPLQAAADGYRQEIRFAIVMYGGVSLAIYMNGIAQELLRLVRATSGADLKGDRVSELYREISLQVRNHDKDRIDERCPTRFVIDILSGTSAGGINAIFLAKALAIRSQDLEQLRQTWLDVADMDKLLSTGGRLEAKRSLLKGDWMYKQLYQAFDGMNDKKLRDSDECHRPERIDLFVTTTDLNGATVPIRLADMDVLEKVHKGCFTFRLDNIALNSPSPLDTELKSLARNDFQRCFDAMLAFAARCTSSFPVAFAPMKLIDIKPVIGRDIYKQRRQKYCEFFRWVPTDSGVVQKCVEIDQRELADGGYLDNKPFGHAIDAMTFRAARLPHKRKLLYVDPFPEVTEDEKCREHFNFVENGLAAATTLPRYQTIREEIARVEFSNITQERLTVLRKLVNKHQEQRFRESFNETIVSADPEENKLSRLIAKFGSLYATYHEVRLLDVSDDLARIVSATHETAQSQDFFLAIRYLVRAWRLVHYEGDGKDGRKLEVDFFTEYDFSFRLRRAAELLEWAQVNMPAASDSLIQQLTRLLRTRERLSIPDKTVNPIWNTIRGVGQGMSWDDIKGILEPTDDDGRFDKAKNLYRKYRDKLDGIADAIREQWIRVFDLNHGEMKALLAAHPRLKEQYKLFDFDDMTSLAFLEGSNVSEHTETEVYRVSPVDSMKPKNGKRRPLNEMLAGYAIWDFGAFLEKKWRENDMLWGRLDACERIVSAVLNDPADEKLRNKYITDLQTAIVEQEGARCTIDLSTAVAKAHEGTLREYMTSQYQLPDAPPPAKSAEQIAKATDILGRMIEEDVGKKNAMTAKLRSLAKFAEGAVAMLVPGGFGRVFFNYWLQLLALMSFLVYVAGRVLKSDELRVYGKYGLSGVALVASFAWVIGYFLTKRSTDDEGRLPAQIVRYIRWIPAIVLTGLVLIGCRHLLDDCHWCRQLVDWFLSA
jgi:patatin-related protein